MPTFLVCTTHWRLTNNFLLPYLQHFWYHMKPYMHVQLAIVATHYHNFNVNIKNQVYWLLTSSVGIKIQKALNCSIGLKKHRAIFTYFGHFQFAER